MLVLMSVSWKAGVPTAALGAGHARANPDQHAADGDGRHAGRDEAPAVGLARALERDADGDDEQAAEDQHPDERADALRRGAQNDSSAIARQVSSRAATTPSQAPIFGSSLRKK